MKILIIEDEPQAAERLHQLILQIEPTAAILAKLDSVKRSIEWLGANASPDLVFMDIQLVNLLSFV